jgi:hypothetical protein
MTTITYEDMAHEIMMYRKFGDRDSSHQREIDRIMQSKKDDEWKWETAYCYMEDHGLIETD